MTAEGSSWNQPNTIHLIGPGDSSINPKSVISPSFAPLAPTMFICATQNLAFLGNVRISIKAPMVKKYFVTSTTNDRTWEITKSFSCLTKTKSQKENANGKKPQRTELFINYDWSDDYNFASFIVRWIRVNCEINGSLCGRGILSPVANGRSLILETITKFRGFIRRFAAENFDRINSLESGNSTSSLITISLHLRCRSVQRHQEIIRNYFIICLFVNFVPLRVSIQIRVLWIRKAF